MNFYLHIPFCRQKCPYCKFALTPVFDDFKKRRYLEYLKKEIRIFFKQETENGRLATVDTIYFGGGTPSVLTPSEVRSLLDCFESSEPTNPQTPKSTECEITFECNPEDITDEYVERILELSINRISLGIQSLNDITLKAIHRSDKTSILEALGSIGFVIARSEAARNDVAIQDDARNTSGSLRSSRGRNLSINIDFIIGLPYSLPGETLGNIMRLHKEFPCITHTSVYLLEDGLYPKEWKKYSMNEEEMQKEYLSIMKYFQSIGWHHYEISNWSKPGYESIHNKGYWDHTESRGFGLSAANFFDSERFENSASFSGYYKGETHGHETITPDEKRLESIIFGIRTFDLDISLLEASKLISLQERGLLEEREGKIKLTSTGIFQENSIIAELI